jgi:hypothetical protein
MVRIGIEASERIGLAAEAMTGPDTIRPQCRGLALDKGNSMLRVANGLTLALCMFSLAAYTADKPVRTFVFDVRDPLHAKVAVSFTDMGGYVHPHSFLRLPNGHVLASFQHMQIGRRYA